ncbi:hypothetical protein M3Y95_00095800 [Aphelenchoides besseyi]|nr:hypothetical protein M3Y95_00095800 [Aphelenchoides besseyi]
MAMSIINQLTQQMPTTVANNFHHNVDRLRQIRIFVPNTYIGAVIGMKGNYIKTLQNATNTGIRVEADSYRLGAQKAACMATKIPSEGKENETEAKSVEEFSSEVADHAVKDGINAACTKELTTNEDVDKKLRRFGNMSISEDVNRLIQITGSTENILKAMFWIYQRVAEVCETSLASIQLHVEFSVPNNVVGIIIGRTGVNIAQLKRISKGCDIHVTTHDEADADVCMFGAFGPCLTVICRINHMRRITNDNENGNNHGVTSNGSTSIRRTNSNDSAPHQSTSDHSNTSQSSVPVQNDDGAEANKPANA